MTDLFVWLVFSGLILFVIGGLGQFWALGDPTKRWQTGMFTAYVIGVGFVVFMVALGALLVMAALGG